MLNSLSSVLGATLTLLRKVTPTRTVPAPVQTHDFRRNTRTYGHDIGITPAGRNKLRAYGWQSSPRIARGDYVLLSHPVPTHSTTSNDTRYQVTNVTYYGDPKDQFTAELEFAPR